jgi:signal transduction histidine kinase/CheY-like chemotaxis protein
LFEARPTPEEEAAYAERLRHQQLQLLCRQWTRSPFVVAVLVGFSMYTAWGYAPIWLICTWAAIVLAIVFTRRAYAQRLLAQPPEDAARALRHMMGFTFGQGFMIGAAAVMFIPSLPLQGRALLTMVLVCWTGGGAATAAAYARAFYVFVLPALLPLAVVWGRTGDPEDLAISALIVLFAMIHTFFVRDNELVVRDSFAIRYENERLLEALERERQEVVLARDRAEDASHAKSRFLAAASHDLRQPLHALSLYAAALKLRAADGTMGEIAQQINRALGSLSALVDSLLDISKLDAEAVKPAARRMSVKSLIERIEADFRPVAREKRIEFRVSSTENDVESDPVLLERVVRNLVDNAFKYTRAGSVVLAAEHDENSVRITVRDTGPGIPESERERIFEEFYQIGNPERDRAEGLGLGLAIVRRLAQLLGLRVKLKSEPGRGSQFSIRLPRAPALGAQPPAVTAAQDADAAALEGRHILVIDDEPAVRVGMRELLELWGCRVAACSGYEEAQRLLDDYDLDVDVIVADLRLRQHENGIETVRRLRERVGEVPALLVTGDTAPERLREAQASGLPLLHKPVSGENLKQEIVAALRR